MGSTAFPQPGPPSGGRSSPEGDGLRTPEFRGADRDALDAVLRAFVVLARARPEDAEAALPLEWCARADERTDALGRSVERLAYMFVRRLTDADDAPSDDEISTESAAVDELSAAAAREFDLEPPERPRIAASTPGVEQAAELIREATLETASAEGHLATTREGRPVLAWAPIPPDTAHVWLLGRLFGRIEAMVAGESLPSLERAISAWYFERWTGRRGGEAVTFTRGVREREWSLVERIMVGLDTTALLALIDSEQFDEVPERQRRVARALRRSFTGVFAVREVDGDRAVLEDPVGRGRFTIHEHSPEETRYAAGYVGVGRLIPFGDVHLRSPGMVFFDAHAGSLAADMARGIARAEDDLPRAILVEGVLTTVIHREEVPRRVLPARNRKDAREVLVRAAEALDDAGLVHAVAPEDVPPDMRREGEELQYQEYDVDGVIAEWMDAAMEQAHGRRR